MKTIFKYTFKIHNNTQRAIVYSDCLSDATTKASKAVDTDTTYLMLVSTEEVFIHSDIESKD